MVKIRLMRIGAKKRPFYRVVAVDERSKRTGGYIELLGTYNPLTNPKEIKLNQERIDVWIKNGAVMSDGFLRIIGKAPQHPARKPKKAPKEEKAPAEAPAAETSEEKAEEAVTETPDETTPTTAEETTVEESNTEAAATEPVEEKVEETAEVTEEQPNETETPAADNTENNS